MADNLYKMVEVFQKQTGVQPHIMMDNIRIQKNIRDDLIVSRYGNMHMGQGTRIRFPERSPDINQVVEHSIGAVKSAIIGELFTRAAEKKKFDPKTLISITTAQMKRFEKGQLFNNGVKHNFNKLPTVWEVIGSPEGQLVIDPNGKVHTGSGGNWPNAEDR